MKITQATPNHATDIAQLVMMAMTDECCLNLAGKGNTLADFARVMNRLTAADHSQYSYRNTLVAIDDDGQVAGAIVSYDGGQLHALRQAFIDEMKREVGIDHSGIADETGPGEWYLDSLAVYPQYRGQGIAHLLLQAVVERAQKAGLRAGLLVDKGNPKAERLYRSIGFEYVNDAMWGGHEMRHLQHA